MTNAKDDAKCDVCTSVNINEAWVGSFSGTPWIFVRARQPKLTHPNFFFVPKTKMEERRADLEKIALWIAYACPCLNGVLPERRGSYEAVSAINPHMWDS